MTFSFTTEGIERLSLEHVTHAFIGRRFARFFPPNGDFEGGTFVGTIQSVETGVEDIDGTPLPGFQFLVQYDDGDQEHMSTAQVMDGMQDAKGVKSKLRRLVERDAEDGGRLAEAPQRKRARAGPAPRPINASQDAEDAGPGPSARPPRAPRPPRPPAGAAVGASGAAAHRGRSRAAPQEALATQGTQGAPAGGASTSLDAVPFREDSTRGVGLPGHLKRIELIDFMCHRHMEMDFGPHVTFISGSNGSGKSATLQALQCALGVAARKTGRASTQKGFIREGADEATIRITLWNRPYAGKDAFQHEIYGDAVTVERRISRGSASAWALKDAAGRVVARRRDDLDAMLSVLGINAANPVTVMTQDTARSFLAASSAKAAQEMFGLYMECTQLGAIAENLAEAQGQIREMESHVGAIKEAHEALEAARDEVKARVDSLSQIEGLREEQERLERALAWTVVGEEEGKAAALAAAAAAAPEQAEAAAAAVEALQREVAALEEAVAGKRRFLQNFDQAAGAALAAEKAAREGAKTTRKRANLLSQKVGRLEKKIEAAQAEKAELEAAQEQAAADLVADAHDVQSEYLRRLGDAQEAYRSAHEQAEALLAAKNEAQAAETAARAAAEARHRAADGAGADVERLESQLRALRSARQGSGAASFGGAAMEKLVRAVDAAVAARRFRHRPIGPVGQFLELTDRRWGRAVESCLQAQGLHTFLVGDDADCRLLRCLIADCFSPRDWARPNVCVLRLDLPPHTIPPHLQPPPGTPTVLRVLRVTDAAVEAPVLNFLVDQQRVERMALARDYDDGKRVVRQPMVLTVYEANGAKRYVRGQTESHDEMAPGAARQPVRLGASTREQAAEVEAALARAREEAGAARAAAADAAVAAAEARAAHEAARQALVARRQAVKETQTALEDVQSQAPAEVLATQLESRGGDGGGGDGGDAPADGGLAADIIAATQRVIDLGRDLDAAREELAAATAEAEAAAAALAAAEEAHARLKEENADHVAGFDEATRGLGAKRGELEKGRAEADATAAERSRAEAELAAAQALAAQMAELAGEVCSREEGAAAVEAVTAKMGDKAGEVADPARRRGFLEKKSERLGRKIGELEREAGGSLADLEAALAAAQAALDGEGARQRAVLALYGHLVRAYQRREKKFKEVDVAVADDVQRRFNHYMRRKGHLGKLKLDRGERRLALTVTIGERGQQGGGRVNDLKQLSGGERSYTTVAFTLALGSTTEMPFRAMDEFDVFMDSVNRRVAMENLLQFAHEQPDLQFLFLTPQDMAAVDEAKAGAARLVGRPIPEDFVKIVQMKPARPGVAEAAAR